MKIKYTMDINKTIIAILSGKGRIKHFQLIKYFFPGEKFDSFSPKYGHIRTL
jgi:hypothetical protein